MNYKNIVFIATSIDGYITDKQGSVNWLHSIPNPNNEDMGYGKLIESIDAIVMGRTTFETVCSFDIDWPYTKPVFVLSNTLNQIPANLKEKVFLLKGTPQEVTSHINKKGYNKIYIDGGTTVQSFLENNLIDELIITTIPILLGGGFALFNELPKPLNFELLASKTYLSQAVQNHYRIKK